VRELTYLGAMELRENDRAPGAQDLWCRLEREGERVVRVGLMHPDGRILFSYPADHFDARLVQRMESGHVRAYLSGAGDDGSRLLWLQDESGRIVTSERIAASDDR
jgi:hypothetical protein